MNEEDEVRLLIQELQNRIGHLVSRYELDISILRIEMVKALTEKDEIIEEQKNKLAELHAKLAPDPENVII